MTCDLGSGNCFPNARGTDKPSGKWRNAKWRDAADLNDLKISQSAAKSIRGGSTKLKKGELRTLQNGGRDYVAADEDIIGRFRQFLAQERGDVVSRRSPQATREKEEIVEAIEETILEQTQDAPLADYGKYQLIYSTIINSNFLVASEKEELKDKIMVILGNDYNTINTATELLDLVDALPEIDPAFQDLIDRQERAQDKVIEQAVANAPDDATYEDILEEVQDDLLDISRNIVPSIQDDGGEGSSTSRAVRRSKAPSRRVKDKQRIVERFMECMDSM